MGLSDLPAAYVPAVIDYICRLLECANDHQSAMSCESATYAHGGIHIYTRVPVS
jgi:hypothetical protein